MVEDWLVGEFYTCTEKQRSKNLITIQKIIMKLKSRRRQIKSWNLNFVKFKFRDLWTRVYRSEHRVRSSFSRGTTLLIIQQPLYTTPMTVRTHKTPKNIDFKSEIPWLGQRSLRCRCQNERTFDSFLEKNSRPMRIISGVSLTRCETRRRFQTFQRTYLVREAVDFVF